VRYVPIRQCETFQTFAKGTFYLTEYWGPGRAGGW
jgi:hypothetical protein